MTTLIKIDGDYANWIKDLSLRFRQSQIKAAIRVNSEMLRFYFSLGADIVNKKAESRWGDGFFKNLSHDLQNALPGVRGFSVTNLKYTKLFYLLYNQLFTISPRVGDQLEIFQIPWSHHKYIIDRCKKDTDKALFYVRKTLENNWSRNVLLNFLDTDLYERQGKAVSNFKSTLPNVDSDLAQQLIKDPYCFDFARLTDRYNEKELKDALEGYNNPLGISEYELSKLFPKDFKGTLPSIEEIEKELGIIF